MPKAQISMEFLIVLFIMILILLIFMPVFSKLQHSVLLAVDTYNAVKSINDFKANVSILNTLEQGSSFVFIQNYINPVVFKCESSAINLDINSKYLHKELSCKIALNCDFSYKIDKKTSFLVKKDTNILNISAIYD